MGYPPVGLPCACSGDRRMEKRRFGRSDVLRAGIFEQTPEQVQTALAEAFACPEFAVVNVKLSRSDFRKGSVSV